MTTQTEEHWRHTLKKLLDKVQKRKLGSYLHVEELVENLLTQERTRLKEEWLREEIVQLKSDLEMEDYDFMVCSKCENVIRERTSHNSEDGFSQCCGKKLTRKQGKQDTYSCHNQAIQTIIDRYYSELEALSKINK